MYTYNVQYAAFRWDQVQERGLVDVKGAVEAFRAFPFRDEFKKGSQVSAPPGPTAPTISFRSHSDGAVLAVWMVGLELYEVYLQEGGEKVRNETSEEPLIIEAIEAFFAGSRADLIRHLGHLPSCVAKPRFWNRLLAGVALGGGFGWIPAFICFFWTGSPLREYLAILIMAASITAGVLWAFGKLPGRTRRCT